MPGSHGRSKHPWGTGGALKARAHRPPPKASLPENAMRKGALEDTSDLQPHDHSPDSWTEPVGYEPSRRIFPCMRRTKMLD